MKNIIFLFIFTSIMYCQNFDPFTGERIPQVPLTGKKVQDCYYDGIVAAKNDFDGKGIFPGVGCGLFGILGWGVGTLAYTMQEPKTPYYYLKDLDGSCRYDFEHGYKSEGKKIRNKNFHTFAGGLAGIFLLVNLASI